MDRRLKFACAGKGELSGLVDKPAKRTGERADVALVNRGLCPSREKAQAFIMAGQVFSGTQRIGKPSVIIKADQALELRGGQQPYKSRGGLKLERALDSFFLAVQDKVALDIGASTGGFTDCLLKRGARKVYAVDVGYGQLDYALRVDERVVVMERTNARHLEPEHLEELADICSIDVSFISLKLILPAVWKCINPAGQVVALIKPQFEAGRELVGKKGVVRSEKTHKQVIEQVIQEAEGIGFSILGLDYSPITGPEGNIEFLLHLKKEGNSSKMPDIHGVVEEAHRQHCKKMFD